MSETLTPAVIELLQGRNMAHVATLMKDGAPHVSPVWIAVEGDRLAIFSTGVERISAEATSVLAGKFAAEPFGLMVVVLT